MGDSRVMTEATKASPAALDEVAAKQQLQFAELLPRVADEYGKSVGTQLKELLSYCVRGNKLSADEYYHMRLFDDATYSPEEKKRFVGLRKSRAIWSNLMSVNKFVGTVADKLAYEKMMGGFGFAVTETIAIAGGHYPEGSIEKLKSLEQCVSFMENAAFPVFGKPINSYQSLGSARFDGFDKATRSLTLANGNVISCEQLWQEIETKFHGDYLFQTCIDPHPALAAICGGGLPTVRVVTLDAGEGPELFRSCIKLTGSGNVADNFWRSGNLLAPIDSETGRMGAALTQMGIDGEYLNEHPVTGAAIDGVELPNWPAIVEMALNAHRMMPRALIFGFDIAISSDGPLLVEANSDPHLIMLQIAHRKGVLDEKMLAAMNYAEQIKAGHMVEVKKTFAKEAAEAKSEIKQAVSSKVA